jgi:predicted small secreted protein
MKSVRSITILALCALALVACNTVSGMGRDVEAAGEAITGTSEKTKEKMH